MVFGKYPGVARPKHGRKFHIHAKTGSNPGLSLIPKGGVPPAQKLSRIKQRIGFALGNLKNGMEDG